MDCTAFEAMAPELALGVADGAERAAAISHLAHCPRCRQLVEDLGRVADDLLLLAPQVEPPLGFEARVHDRIVAAGSTGRTRNRPRLRAAAAAAAIVVVAGLGGLVAGRLTAGSRSTAAAVGITRSTEGTCRVVALAGHPAEVVVRLDEPTEASADYIVDAVPARGGTPVWLGALHVQGGRAVLDATVPAGTGAVSAVRVTDARGTLHYWVAFRAV
jgi:hypothetical protein